MGVIKKKHNKSDTSSGGAPQTKTTQRKWERKRITGKQGKALVRRFRRILKM